MAEGTLDRLGLDAAAARRVRTPGGPSVCAGAGRAPARSLHASRRGRGRCIPVEAVDLCHLGFWLGLGAHVLGDDPRLPGLGEAVLSAQYDDGGWNCQMRNYPERRHSSFNTTFNVLENVRIAAAQGAIAERSFREAEARAVEFMLVHRMHRSDKTGEVVSDRFTHLTYPGTGTTRCCVASTTCASHRPSTTLVSTIRSSSSSSQGKPNGRWPLQKRIPGTFLVDMEHPGGDSRWNTLRAMRVLRVARRRSL